MKNKIHYVCQNCGYRSAKWLGKCPSCEAWNSFSEEVTNDTKKIKHNPHNEKPTLISEVNTTSVSRYISKIQEFDRVLGGGLVPGSVILLGGDPGIGKSTLLLQVCAQFPINECLFVSGEESKEQISLRFKRIYGNNKDLSIFTETNLEEILSNLKEKKYKFVVIDSIQSVYSEQVDSIAGSILQIRECASRLVEFAKQSSTSIILVGHITKEGNLAGPKLLEHIVDVVLQFEGDKHYSYRILRSLKNRYGSTNEIGIFEMGERGLVEIKNPSDVFLNNLVNTPGVAISCAIEGTRPLLIEVQALVSTSGYSYPQRNTNGFDMKRLQLIIAVLEKKLGLNFGNRDVFVNIAGGFRIDDTALDLAVALAIISSYFETIIPQKAIVVGEVGLTGEIRSVSHLDARIKEAEKLGFQLAILPKVLKSKDLNPKIKPIFVETLNEAFDKIFNSIKYN